MRAVEKSEKQAVARVAVYHFGGAGMKVRDGSFFAFGVSQTGHGACPLPKRFPIFSLKFFHVNLSGGGRTCHAY